MDRAERQLLRTKLAHWKPRHHVEVEVSDLRRLLDVCDQYEVHDPHLEHRISFEHYAFGRAVEGCYCNACEAFRVHARMQAAAAEGTP
jgi:hypothetical protein